MKKNQFGFKTVIDGILISGSYWYPKKYWREALICYINETAQGKKKVKYRPQIIFSYNKKTPSSCFALHLDAEAGEYFGYGTSSEAHPKIPGDDLIIINGKKSLLEWALICFLSDSCNKALLIKLPYDEKLNLWDQSSVMLWKGEKNILHATAVNIPTLEEFQERVYQREDW